MGFFSLSAVCGCCGKEIGLNRFKQGMTTSGKEIWACADCVRKNRNKAIKIDYETGKIMVLDATATEVRMKCNTCGHVYCYNAEDINKNRQLAKEAAMNSVLGIGEAVAGTRIGAQIATNTADAKINQIVDYTRCPKCNSADVRQLSESEWQAEKNKTETSGTSAADEIKKFKELLDQGIITQEEFDAKKKQLLGL